MPLPSYLWWLSAKEVFVFQAINTRDASVWVKHIRGMNMMTECHSAENIFRLILLNENVAFWLKFQFVPKDPIDNMLLALVLVIA